MSLIDPTQRIRPYESIYNFRDFGGYSGADGRPVKTGALFRSAHLNNLNETDIADIDALGIGHVIDLRHAPERARQPSKWPGCPDRNVSVLTLPENHERESQKVAPHEAFLETRLETAEDARNYMINSYSERPNDPGFKAIFRSTLKAMASDENKQGGVLVHCAAGKDRTGTLCALIQSLLGVSQDDILSDYLLTLEAVDIEGMLEPAAQMFSQRYGRAISADAIRPMFGVEADYLFASLARIGDATTYAENALDISAAEIAAIRSRYLAA